MWRTVAPPEVGENPQLRFGPGGETVVGGDDQGVTITSAGRIGRTLDRCPSPVFGPDSTRVAAVPFRYIEACDGSGKVKWGLRWGAAGLSRIGAIDAALVPSPDVDAALPTAPVLVGSDTTTYVGLPAGTTRSLPRQTIVGRIVALSGADGATKWSKNLLGSAGWIGLTPDGTLLVEDHGGGVLRAYKPDGADRFTLAIDGQFFGASVGKDGLTYVIDGADTTYGVNGPVPARRRLRAFLSDGTVTVSRVFAESGHHLLGLGPDGAVYISSQHTDGTFEAETAELRALTPEGRDLWSTGIWSAGSLGAPAFRKDGAIVIGDGSAVYAFGSKLQPNSPPIARAHLVARSATFRIEGPPTFCVSKIKRRCVRQAPPLGTMLRLDLPSAHSCRSRSNASTGRRNAELSARVPNSLPPFLSRVRTGLRSQSAVCAGSSQPPSPQPSNRVGTASAQTGHPPS